MLSKHRRVTKSLFNKVIKEGHTLHGNLLYFRYIPKSVDKYSHFSFVAPKSVAKSAVLRNKLRRKGYSALRSISTKDAVGILFFKKEAKNSIVKDLNLEIASLFRKADLIK